MEEKKCKYCTVTIPEEAKICPNCKKPQGTSTGVKILAAIFILMGIGMCQNLTSTKEPPRSATTTAPYAKASGATPSPSAQVNGWKYGEYKDEMSEKVHKYATVESTNTVNFAFPYQGEQRGTIMATDNSILFYVEKGQVVCQGEDEYGTCLVRVKFDDGKDKYVSARTSGDKSITIKFTEPGFYNNLIKSKKLMIEPEIYQNGRPVFTFIVTGLKKDIKN